MNKAILFGAALLGLTGVSLRAEEGWFRSGELSVAGFGTYVDKVGEQWGVGGEVAYFFTRHLGVGAVTHWEDFGGRFIDNLAAEAYLRLPIDALSLAPYGVVTAGRAFETGEWFQSFGAGAEFRFTANTGLFADVQWQFNNVTRDGAALRAGLRIAF